MRRALVLVSVFGAALSGTNLALAAGPAAAAPAGVAGEIERNVDLDEFRVEGFGIDLLVQGFRDEVTATLIVTRGPQIAYYTAPAVVSAERVTAHFGALGGLDYRFVPQGSQELRCLGAGSEDPVTFEGTFTFTGERGYVHVDAPHAEGSVTATPAPQGCRPAVAARTAAVARRVVPYHPVYSGHGATVDATAGSPDKGPLRQLEIADGADKGRHRLRIRAFESERAEGVSISRGVQMTAPSSAFRRNLTAGFATVRPPAPLTGSAHFVRRAHGPPAWTGSLRMPIFGGDPVRLAGPGFRATLHKGTFQDE
jgi:hypothetical protein